PAVGVQLPLLDPVGVDEVEALVGWAAIEHLAARGVGYHGVPAYVRQDLRVEATDGTRPLPRALDLGAAVGAVGEFYAVFEEDLHAHANAEHRTAAGEPLPDQSCPLDLAQARHTARERPHPGHEEAIGGQHRLRVVRGGAISSSPPAA